MTDLFNDLPPEVKRMLRQMESLRKHMPWTMKFLEQNDIRFRGLSIFPSDRGGYVVAVRTYRSDGQPMVGYSNGLNPYGAFEGIESVILLDKLYPDKKAQDYDSDLPNKL